MPFESALNTGAFVAAVPGGTPNTLTQYFADPLNRPSSVTPPNWNATTYTYGANVASNVKLDHSANTYFAANSLYRTTVNDANGNQSSTFKDKKGRLVLSRRHNPGELHHLCRYLQSVRQQGQAHDGHPAERPTHRRQPHLQVPV